VGGEGPSIMGLRWNRALSEGSPLVGLNLRGLIAFFTGEGPEWLPTLLE
jgi:hypothetical protein